MRLYDGVAPLRAGSAASRCRGANRGEANADRRPLVRYKADGPARPSALRLPRSGAPQPACYISRLTRALPGSVLAALTAVWFLFAAPALIDRASIYLEARSKLAERTMDERSALLDYPAYTAAEEIAGVVPPEECVLILAYASADGFQYYRTRFPYLLYPRRVELSNKSSEETACPFLAVFRDIPANLGPRPSGEWNQQQLERRLEDMTPVMRGDRVSVYRRR